MINTDTIGVFRLGEESGIGGDYFLKMVSQVEELEKIVFRERNPLNSKPMSVLYYEMIPNFKKIILKNFNPRRKTETYEKLIKWAKAKEESNDIFSPDARFEKITGIVRGYYCYLTTNSIRFSGYGRTKKAAYKNCLTSEPMTGGIEEEELEI